MKKELSVKQVSSAIVVECVSSDERKCLYDLKKTSA